MTFRSVYGYNYSENGWRMVNRSGCSVGGPLMGLPYTNTAPIRSGIASTILVAWLHWYHHNVEQLSSPVWGWSAENAVPNSNHLSGTAVDINAPRYPWGSRTMPSELITLVRKGLALFDGCVYWGADWQRADEMHYQIAYPEGDERLARLASRLSSGYLGIYQEEGDMAETYPSFVPGSDYVGPLADFVRHIDRKMEELHRSMVPAVLDRLADIETKLDRLESGR